MSGNVSVFVSHSHKDNEFTERLVRDLIAAGADVWVDMDAITYDGIIKRINEGLGGRQWLVLVMSPDALSSEYVQMEVNAALHRVMNKWMRGVIPITARPCDPMLIPPTWAILRRYDASQGYAEAFVQLSEALGLAQATSAVEYLANQPLADVHRTLIHDYSNGGLYSNEPGYDPYAYPGAIRLVDPSGQTRYQTVQSAIIESDPGDYVYVLPGTYYEALHLDKPVVLVGQGRREEVIISHHGNEPTVTIAVDNSASWAHMANEDRDKLNARWRYDVPAILSNVTILHSAPKSGPEDIGDSTAWGVIENEFCAICNEESYVEIRNCEIRCVQGNGIYLMDTHDGYAGPQVMVSNCGISRCGGNGVFADFTGQLKIENSDLYENSRDGVLADLGASSQITIENCRIHKNKGNGVRLWLMGDEPFLLEGSRIEENRKYGVNLDGCFNEEEARQKLINNSVGGNGDGDVSMNIDCSRFYADLEWEAEQYKNYRRTNDDGPPDFDP